MFDWYKKWNEKKPSFKLGGEQLGKKLKLDKFIRRLSILFLKWNIWEPSNLKT